MTGNAPGARDPNTQTSLRLFRPIFKARNYMRANSPGTSSSQAPEKMASSIGDRLLIDMAELARLTSLSIRTLRRMDASREIPGRVAVRRCVRFQNEVVREWVRAGLPSPEQWAARHGPS
jgi:predicted DNA-binding transcriptional regulator AlpA